MTIYHKSVHDGSDLVAPTVLSGIEKIGLAYTSSAENIANFDIDTMPANATGVFTISPINVEYIYKRQDAGNVIIEYLDENGNVPLVETTVLNGSEQIGVPYT